MHAAFVQRKKGDRFPFNSRHWQTAVFFHCEWKNTFPATRPQVWGWANTTPTSGLPNAQCCWNPSTQIIGKDWTVFWTLHMRHVLMGNVLSNNAMFFYENHMINVFVKIKLTCNGLYSLLAPLIHIWQDCTITRVEKTNFLLSLTMCIVVKL